MTASSEPSSGFFLSTSAGGGSVVVVSPRMSEASMLEIAMCMSLLVFGTFVLFGLSPNVPRPWVVSAVHFRVALHSLL
jgi:hypothetical protein